MKRKKNLEPAWMNIVVILSLATFAVSITEGALRKRTHDDDPAVVGNLGYQRGVGAPRPDRRARSVGEGDTVPGRRLLSDNATTVAPEGDKSVWQQIEDFYADDNNMAMYCVLPMIVLVYGGCSAIYCVYKCRRYLRRRKHKRLRNDDDGSEVGDDRNDLSNDLMDNGVNGERPIKTVSGSTWDDGDSYNVQQKLHRQDSYNDNARSRDNNNSAGSRDSTAMLERERDKLEQRLDPKPTSPSLDHFVTQKPMQPPQSKAADFSRFANARPIEIVPISQKEYQRQMETGSWDPLHNRPFDSRNSTDDPDAKRSGRESSWSIRDEIMAKYDALTSLAMAKKTADVLRVNAASGNPNLDGGHHPDTLKRKAGKKNKLIFIAE